ncbi:uncharacterized protein [Primulina huaijiensis]|uniref:uncharacterized protein n=1 Tax=Primulina huaijiensis TaxID=1492673 RepID=UPI003CC797C4
MMMHAYINQQVNEGTRRGSIPGHVVIRHDKEIADRNLFNDYFSENPKFHEGYFRRRFKMSHNLFLRIVDAVKNHDSYYIQRSDGLGRLGLSTNQKTTVAIRLLTYGLPADAADEYIKIGESTVIKCLQHFCRAVVKVFANQYLRSPNANDVARLLYIGKQRGFPGMLGSLDCIAPPAHYTICGNEYDTGYYLADAWSWRKNDLHYIMKACIIVHNMIIEDERDLSAPIQDAMEAPTPDVEMVVNDENARFQEFLVRYKKIKNRDAHYELRNALIEHFVGTI